MSPIRMKKWKCASIVPPDMCTSTDEQNTRPAVAKKDAKRRLRASRANTRQTAGVATSSAEWPRP